MSTPSFTDLREPYLISAGLVAATGRELYFEIAGVSSHICSSFVRDTMLPLLDGPRLTPIQITGRLSEFLAPYGKSVTFFSDAPRYNIELLKPFLPANLNLDVAVPSFEDDADELTYQAAYEAAFESGLRRHHALDDGRAAYRAWLALHRRG